VSGIVLWLAGIALCGASAWQLVLASAVDDDGPVTDVQRRLEALRIARVRTTQWCLLLGPVLWAPCLDLVLRRVIGVAVSDVPGWAYLLTNLAFGVAFALGAYGIARRLAPRYGSTSFMRRLVRDFAGANLTAAIEDADAIAAFAREDGPDQ
jgi:hypothetical protein